jgi:electron transport complex protein RnfE
MKHFVNGIIKENPVLVLMLGLCPVLAVSGTFRDALGMGVAAICVLLGSNLVISLIRRGVPSQLRIPIFIIVISTFVTIIDYTMQAYQPELYKMLGVFVPLIVVNCIILARAEAFASKHSVSASILDALGIGIGFILAIGAMGFLRELLGNGSIGGRIVLGESFHQNPVLFMILPPGAFLVIAFLMAAMRKWRAQ